MMKIKQPQVFVNACFLPCTGPDRLVVLPKMVDRAEILLTTTSQTGRYTQIVGQNSRYQDEETVVGL